MNTIQLKLLIQWNLSKTATCGPVLTDLYREVAALQRYVDCNALVLFAAREAGCFRNMAAKQSDSLRQAPLYNNTKATSDHKIYWLAKTCIIQVVYLPTVHTASKENVEQNTIQTHFNVQEVPHHEQQLGWSKMYYKSRQQVMLPASCMYSFLTGSSQLNLVCEMSCYTSHSEGG